ncbi:MAG: serine/threonine protein phosphatase [Chlorobium sp.]|nr:MAG: serine/threonine protein phosphatase [Chlorobium sp.]
MQPDLSESRRIIAIGDVHGCILPLKKLIRLLKPEAGDQLVFLGDLIDRGDHSKEVIDYLIELSSRFSCHFIMGNHELMYLEYLENQNTEQWLYCGGRATLKSYNILNGNDLPDSHRVFIRSFQYYIQTENYFFTHGGLDPELSIIDNLRYYKPEEFCWQKVHMRQVFLESNNYNWNKTVVCAHTPVPEPVMLDHLIAIDTGCVYNENPLMGKLTAVVLPERRIINIKNPVISL